MAVYGTLEKREGNSGSRTSPALIAITALVAVTFVAIAAYVYTRRNRPPSYKTPSIKVSPIALTTSRLHETDVCDCNKEEKSSWYQLHRLSAILRLRPRQGSVGRAAEAPYNASARSLTNDTEIGSNIDHIEVNRNTSIRSILTLPAYNPSPRADERLVAREGERAGVDRVVELPETADEEEVRREEDMEALYQIRQARRREIEERNERRRQRQEAREQGDWARLEQLRLDAQRRARERSNSNVSAGSSTTSLPQAASSRELMAEHTARAESRDRRISSVSYASLGVARHDGSRLRAESVESDHQPLLDSAASISGNNASQSREASIDTDRRRSRFHLPQFMRHGRSISDGSALTTDSENAIGITPQTSSEQTNGQESRPGDGSRSTSESDPVNDHSMQTPSSSDASPPGYSEPNEAPPEYSSPVRAQEDGVPRLPSVRVNTQLTDLPVIEIVESTPIVPRS